MRGSGRGFEEKLIPTMNCVLAFCATELGGDESEVFDWSLLVPVDSEGAIVLPLWSSYGRTTTVRGAQRTLPVAKHLACECRA